MVQHYHNGYRDVHSAPMWYQHMVHGGPPCCSCDRSSTIRYKSPQSASVADTSDIRTHFRNPPQNSESPPQRTVIKILQILLNLQHLEQISDIGLIPKEDDSQTTFQISDFAFHCGIQLRQGHLTKFDAQCFTSYVI